MTESQTKQSPATDVGGPWTSRRLLRWMAEYFQREGVEPPRVVAEMLLSHVLGCDRTRLYMEADRPATAEELHQLRALVRRAAAKEPVQYLVGTAPFFVLDFEVDDCTMIPQPSTETLVGHMLEWIRASPDREESHILDLGTGCGPIAIALARHAPGVSIVATDIVPAALELAGRNAERHRVEDRIEFRPGSLLSPVAAHERFDVICSNPPYIPDHEWSDQVEEGVKRYVPATALRGGADGLEYIRPIVGQAPEHLTPGGLLAIEIADCQKDAAIALAESTGSLVNIQVLRDSDGYWRVLSAERRS